MKPAPSPEELGRAPDPSSLATLAPRWHTAALVALILAVAATGIFLQQRAGPAGLPMEGGACVARYLPVLLVQWALVIYVVRIGRDRSALAPLLGVRWRSVSASRAVGDAACALLAWGAIEGLAIAFARALGPQAVAGARALLPATAGERVAWVIVAVNVGICEELVYRGLSASSARRVPAKFRSRDRASGALLFWARARRPGEEGSRSEAGLSSSSAWCWAESWWRAREQSLLPGMLAHVAGGIS